MTILAIAQPTFQPAMRIITNITNANPAVVTTSFNHQYKNGTIIRLDVPNGYGMVQANQLYGPIVVLSPTTFSIAIDTRFFDSYTTPSTAPLNEQYPQSVPIGEIDTTLAAATLNILNANVPGGI